MSEAERGKYTPEERRASILFCPGCFATEDDSSGGGGLVPEYCMNCGGQPISVPRWAALSIRRQASWVGKRYYPHEEDLAALDGQK